ncbi:MAG: hypothetical protein QXL88_00355 [Candidatus Pacearchaeota archaeon]
MQFSKTLKELREKSKKRGFDQTLDLIINLKDFDPKRESLSVVVSLPYPFKKKKIAAFLENPIKSDALEKVILKADLEKITPKEIKKLVKKIDFFIANAKLMPLIASKFGKIFGSSGKMPDPTIGCIISQENVETIKNVCEKLNKITKIKIKEASIKMAVGKESMKDEMLLKNLEEAFKTIVEKLPKKELNVKNVMLKFTMSPALKVKNENDKENT